MKGPPVLYNLFDAHILADQTGNCDLKGHTCISDSRLLVLKNNQLYTNGFCLQMKRKDFSIRMKHEVFFLTNVFPCISFRNINRGTLKNIRESISTSLSSIFGSSVSENAISSP